MSDNPAEQDRATDSCCFVGPQSASGGRQELRASLERTSRISTILNLLYRLPWNTSIGYLFARKL